MGTGRRGPYPRSTLRTLVLGVALALGVHAVADAQQAAPTALSVSAAAAPVVPVAPPQQVVVASDDLARRFARTVVVPQRQAFRLAPDSQPVNLERVDVWATILGRQATTTLAVRVSNGGTRPEEAELLLPVPAGAVIREFRFDGAAPDDVTARLLERDDARGLYEDIVRRMRDPALLEFAGRSFIRSSVFPVAPGGHQVVTVTYEEVLPADGPRVDYLLPRSSSPHAAWTPWDVQVRIQGDAPVTSVYSPSHRVTTERLDERRVYVDAGDAADGKPGAALGDLRLSYVATEAEAAMTFLSVPDEDVGGGWFLLLADLPSAMLRSATAELPRDVTLVLDRSGSMRGEKFEQAREAALQVIAGLSEDDTFDVVDYAADVARFAAGAVRRTPESLAEAEAYLARLVPTGGTNLHGALLEALRRPTPEGALSVVLFLTDGVPTEGVTDEARILEEAVAANGAGRRVFTFGVGYDVNAPLLDAVAEGSRARSAYVAPEEDVEVEVGRVFRRLTGPVFETPRLVATAPDGTPRPDALRELQPADLPDVYEGDQLVALGMYSGTESVHVRLEGTLGTEARHVDAVFDPSHGAPDNGFVSRLWASRKTGALIEEVRRAGAGPATAHDPRLAELVAEIVALSTEFGILTEYTSFLALEGTDLDALGALHSQARTELTQRVQNVRSGRHAVNQAVNLRVARQRRNLAGATRYRDAQGRAVSIEGVREVNGRAFFRRAGRWVAAEVARQRRQRAHREARAEGDPVAAPSEGGSADGAGSAVAGAPPAGSAAAPGGDAPAAGSDRTVIFGTPEYFELVQRLAETGSQRALSVRGELQIVVDGEIVLVLPEQQ